MKSKLSLAITHPDVALQWHPTKNGNLTPNDVSYGSGISLWWKCPKGDDHIWRAKVLNRTTGKTGCPICSGNIAVLSNCLQTKHPELAHQWHPTKNGKLTPYDVTAGSNKKVWWKCPRGEDHEWQAVINSRVAGSGCPICSGYKVVKSNSLAYRFPKLAKEWDYARNKKVPERVYYKSNKKYWWKCPKGDDHIWRASPELRVNRGHGCPYCSNHKASSQRNLAVLFPNLLLEWDYELNRITPEEVLPGSDNTLNWVCAEGHRWRAKISTRVYNNTGCPYCSGRNATEKNNLTITHPELVAEWHPDNSLKPDQVKSGGHQKILWKCRINSNHIWSAPVYNRTKGSGCPWCNILPQSREELTIIFELKLFFPEISHKGHKIRIEKKIHAVDIFISRLNLIIEYDGNFWHKDKLALDKNKTDILSESGYHVIRLRQKPLSKINPSDLIIPYKPDLKKVVNQILIKMINHYNLDSATKNKINSYLNLEELQNVKAFNRYIDDILIRKSNSNKKNG